MRLFYIALSSLILVGCVRTHKQGTSEYDRYDGVAIDQMVGNNVSGKVMEKTVLCLNARRETRLLSAITNQQVLTVTNPVVVALTNDVISTTTNYQVTRMTSLRPPSAVVVQAPAETVPGEAEAGDAPEPGPAEPVVTTNETVSQATNATATVAPNQTTANLQISRNYNTQVTTESNALTLVMVTNLVVTTETNTIVNYSTNLVIANVTNLTITPVRQPASDYYLYTELLGPSDFNPFTGESLVLLVDGVRYGFAATNSTTPLLGRKGYATTLYAVPPEVLVAIANSREVLVRVRGANSVIEKKMSRGSRKHFRQYLLKFFQPDPDPAALNLEEAAMDPQPRRVATATAASR